MTTATTTPADDNLAEIACAECGATYEDTVECAGSHEESCDVRGCECLMEECESDCRYTWEWTHYSFCAAHRIYCSCPECDPDAYLDR